MLYGNLEKNATCYADEGDRFNLRLMPTLKRSSYNMITINYPEIVKVDEKSRLTTMLDIDGEQKELWFEVDEEYEKYLCYERSDACLIGVLQYAMRKKHDITCLAPVTGELLYNLNHHLFPVLCKTVGSFYHPKIFAEATSQSLENHGAVGTGMSCGVDSLHAVANHYNPTDAYTPKLTHLIVYNVAHFHTTGFKNYGKNKIKEETYAHAKEAAKALNLPLIETNSNIYECLACGHQWTYFMGYAILSMQKLWKTFLFASSYDYSKFTLDNHDSKCPGYYDLLSMNCFSTSQLRIYSEGGGVDRVEKTSVVADFYIAPKYLLVCWVKGSNCGVCSKCRRTMLTLDILGKLDNFKDSFPVDYYRTHLDDYLKWLVANVNEEYCQDIYAYALKGKHADKIKSITMERDYGKLIAHNHDVLEKISIIEKKIDKFSTDKETANVKLKNSQERIKQLEASTSWKLTKPFRLIVNTVRKRK